MGTGGTGDYFVVMDTTGNVIVVRQSGTSYGAAYIDLKNAFRG